MKAWAQIPAQMQTARARLWTLRKDDDYSDLVMLGAWLCSGFANLIAVGLALLRDQSFSTWQILFGLTSLMLAYEIDQTILHKRRIRELELEQIQTPVEKEGNHR